MQRILIGLFIILSSTLVFGEEIPRSTTSEGFYNPVGRYKVAFLGVTPGEKIAFFRVLDTVDNTMPFNDLPYQVLGIDLSDEYGMIAYGLVLAAKLNDTLIARIRYERGALNTVTASGLSKLLEVNIP